MNMPSSRWVRRRSAPVTLTLSKINEIALEVVSSLPPIQYKASSETYALSRKDIETLPAWKQ